MSNSRYCKGEPEGQDAEQDRPEENTILLTHGAADHREERYCHLDTDRPHS